VENVPWDSKGEALGISFPSHGNSPLYDFERSGAGEGWHAVCTRLRWEKRIDYALRQHHIDTYLPLIQESHRWSDRSKIIEVPLFPGYIFVRMAGAIEQRLCILQTNGVLGFAGRPREGTAVCEAEIENLRQLLAFGERVSPHPFLQAGQRARICSGALQGVEGIIQSARSGRKLVISIQLIQRSVAVTCEGYEVVPLE